MNLGLHHLIERYREESFATYLIKSEWFRSLIKRAIYVVGVFSILIPVPQLVNILAEKNAAGVSLITWVGFLISSSTWLLYGIIHGDKPIIITNVGAFVVDLLIIASIIAYR